MFWITQPGGFLSLFPHSHTLEDNYIHRCTVHTSASSYPHTDHANWYLLIERLFCMNNCTGIALTVADFRLWCCYDQIFSEVLNTAFCCLQQWLVVSTQCRFCHSLHSVQVGHSPLLWFILLRVVFWVMHKFFCSSESVTWWWLFWV